MFLSNPGWRPLLGRQCSSHSNFFQGARIPVVVHSLLSSALLLVGDYGFDVAYAAIAQFESVPVKDFME